MLIVDPTMWVDFFNGIENPQTDYLYEIADKTSILSGDDQPRIGITECAQLLPITLQRYHGPQNDRQPDCNMLHGE